MYEYCYKCLHECDNDICRECTNSTVKGAIPTKFEPLQMAKDVPTVAKKDPVNHPSHHETGEFKCIDVMKEVFGIDALQNFCLLSAFKCLYDCEHKTNKEEDIKKANWYLNKRIDLESEKHGKP